LCHAFFLGALGKTLLFPLFLFPLRPFFRPVRHDFSRRPIGRLSCPHPSGTLISLRASVFRTETTLPVPHPFLCSFSLPIAGSPQFPAPPARVYLTVGVALERAEHRPMSTCQRRYFFSGLVLKNLPTSFYSLPHSSFHLAESDLTIPNLRYTRPPAPQLLPLYATHPLIYLGNRPVSF